MEKKWKKPKLLVLVRTNPEEAVLNSCKFSPDSGCAYRITCRGELISDPPPVYDWCMASTSS